MTVLAITTPGLPEMVVIGLIFVLLFGAKKLPELGGAIGKSIKSFKQGVDDGKDEESPDDAPSEPAGSTSTDDASAPIAREGQ